LLGLHWVPNLVKSGLVPDTFCYMFWSAGLRSSESTSKCQPGRTGRLDSMARSAYHRAGEQPYVQNMFKQL